MITVSEALAILAAAVRPTGREEIRLREASWRVLAQEVHADRDWPPFETSAMDGYAVRLDDVREAGCTVAERLQTVAAGDSPPPAISPGEAVRVMTGAPIPPGTEAIIPVEQARREGGRVRFETVPASGAHLRRRGESVGAGTALLAPGRRLTPLDISLAALAGADPITVYRGPRVSIAVTGNELVPVSADPGPGQIRDSNGPMLLALCLRSGWRTIDRGRVADDETGLVRLFAEAGPSEDLLVTTGGVSAGDLDLLPDLAQRAGFELLFHGVAVRPGKPIVFGKRDRTLWFGLPGNPVSASVGFHLFVAEGLRRLEGDANPGQRLITARLSQNLRATGPRETYRDAVWKMAEAESRVEPLASKGSHDLAAHARANALIRTAAGSPALPAGALVECVLLESTR